MVSRRYLLSLARSEAKQQFLLGFSWHFVLTTYKKLMIGALLLRFIVRHEVAALSKLFYCARVYVLSKALCAKIYYRDFTEKGKIDSEMLVLLVAKKRKRKETGYVRREEQGNNKMSLAL